MMALLLQFGPVALILGCLAAIKKLSADQSA